MQNGKKRYSLLLATILCFSLIGIPAFAADGAPLDYEAIPANVSNTTQELNVEDAIDFVYIDQAVLGLGSAQNIAFGLKDGAPIDEATLVLHRTDNGALLTFEATTIVDNSALFTFVFESNSDLAAYELDAINYVVAGAPITVSFSEKQITSVVVTNDGEIVASEEGDGDNRPYAFDVVGTELSTTLKSSAASEGEVVAFSVSEEGELEAHATIEEALACADEEAQAADEYHMLLGEETSQVAFDADNITSGFSFVQALAFFAPEKAYAASDGIFVVGLDPGHGGNDPGAIGYGLEERDINWKIAVACRDELNTYHNVTAVLSRNYDENPGLAERVDRLIAAGAKVVVSLHNNASGSGAGYGSEIWVPNDSPYMYQETHVAGEQLGQRILDKLCALGLANRGIKTRDAIVEGYDYYDTHNADGSIADYYTFIGQARRYGVPGIIVEHAFIDNASDASFLSSDDNLRLLGIADAQGIADQYGLTKQSVEDKYRIMGNSQTTPAQMAAYFESKGHPYPSSVYAQYGASNIEDFCQILFEEASAEGVRAEVVFCQTMLETGWLQFGGSVSADQCNFCGLGATGGGNPGNSFNTYGQNSVRMGLRAQIQHLKAYASSDSLNNPLIDPRFNYVARGCAPSVDDLGGKWASDTNYGSKIKALMDALLSYPVAAPNLTLTLSEHEMGGVSSVYIDGVEYPTTWENGSATISLPDQSRRVLQTYEFNTSSTDLNTVYPTHFRVWFLTFGNGGYTIIRASSFDDIMKYAGSSIRITGKNGIRMITEVPSSLKTTLLNQGIDGYKLLEYGTVVARDSRLEGNSLTLGTNASSGGYAFKKGVADSIYKLVDDAIQYTNVLVGFSMDDCKDLLTMRSYMKLSDPYGNEVVLYGGPVHRSIGYIALQNKAAFPTGTAAYDYVWEIIHYVYGADAK